METSEVFIDTAKRSDKLN